MARSRRNGETARGKGEAIPYTESPRTGEPAVGQTVDALGGMGLAGDSVNVLLCPSPVGGS